MGLMRADLHVHTCYSVDCTTTLEQVIERCLKTGINCVAVTDHGTTAGGLALQKLAPFKVIAGQEILTHEGEIIGLFLTRDVPSGMSAREAMAHVKDQGGLVCLPHPCDRLRASVMRNGHKAATLLDAVDLVETFNARSLDPVANARASKLARKYRFPCSAGSDAHTPGEIGNTYVEVSDFQDPASFLEALAQGHISGCFSNPLLHFVNIWTRLTGSMRSLR